ncbi:hypothetical protein [Streptomyces sp. NPDC002172]
MAEMKSTTVSGLQSAQNYLSQMHTDLQGKANQLEQFIHSTHWGGTAATIFYAKMADFMDRVTNPKTGILHDLQSIQDAVAATAGNTSAASEDTQAMASQLAGMNAGTPGLPLVPAGGMVTPAGGVVTSPADGGGVVGGSLGTPSAGGGVSNPGGGVSTPGGGLNLL